MIYVKQWFSKILILDIRQWSTMIPETWGKKQGIPCNCARFLSSNCFQAGAPREGNQAMISSWLKETSNFEFVGESAKYQRFVQIFPEIINVALEYSAVYWWVHTFKKSIYSCGKNHPLEGIVQMRTTGWGIDLQAWLDCTIRREEDRVPRIVWLSRGK